ncbi:Site-specific recombinase XerD [Aliiroseovarius halocynthiae]|uniref:Site-specific integrase n=1 Tax=Aliiroseovarius halocynthiae TaxID=985055 RepID=A0A545SMS5_9RHOB|nr:site-specific integrase [Aliiroseovarius halocynthiae]TQV66269.1 site-specific integrase [Aliiroseovarius halocynthiae]SMR82609.1 Site-specific recombinase XerD [Aliiroseovarius halocynthiae]
MARLYKRTKTLKGKEATYYVVRFKDQDGKLRDRQFTRRYEADAFIEEVAELVRQKAFSVTATMPFRDLAEKFLEASAIGRNGRKPLVRRTIYSYRMYLNKYLLPRIGDTPINQLNRAALNELVQELIMDTNKRATARHAFAVVKVCLTYATEMDYLPSHAARGIVVQEDPSEYVDKDGSGTEEERFAVPTRGEIRKILKTAKERRDTYPHKQVRDAWKRFYPMIMFLALTGVRSSEMRAVRWSDIDWIERKVRIRRSADGETCEIGPLKSRHARRDVPLPEPLYQELLAIRRDDSSLIFGGPKTGRPPTHSTISFRHWHPLLEEAGVKKYGLHALRHYYATQLLSSNVDLLSVKRWMGHHSAAFTIDRYGHYIKENATKRIQKVKF